MGNDIAVGNFSGRWELIDATKTMRHVLALNGCIFNLDIIIFRPVDIKFIIRTHFMKCHED